MLLALLTAMQPFVVSAGGSTATVTSAGGTATVSVNPGTATVS